MRRVVGIVKAQYIQNLCVMTLDASHWRDGTAKRAEKKVPGRKSIVMTAIVFIAEESFFAAAAVMIEISVSIAFEAHFGWREHTQFSTGMCKFQACACILMSKESEELEIIRLRGDVKHDGQLTTLD